MASEDTCVVKKLAFFSCVIKWELCFEFATTRPVLFKLQVKFAPQKPVPSLEIEMRICINTMYIK